MKDKKLDFKLPKNIKQIGSVDEKFKIYMEDYVFSFLNQYAAEKKCEEVIAVLIGENQIIEDKNVLFISGAIKGEYVIEENGILKLTEKSFEKIDENIKNYFPNKEIVGWFYSQPGFSDYINDEYINYHKITFKKDYEVFFLNDPVEKVFSFYRYNKNAFESIKGFIIYYEKNEQMNEYMLANKKLEINLEKEKFKQKDERLMELKRKNMPEKSRAKAFDEQRKMVNLFGSLSAVLFLVCFIMGAGLIQSDDRISDLESRLLKLDKSYKYILTQFKDDNVQSVFAESNPNSIKTSETINEYTTELTTQVTTELSTQITTQAPTELPTQTTIQTTTTKTPEKTYVVKEGDTLELISRKFYGTRNKIEEIMEINKIDDANKIYSGMTLNLP